MKKIVSIVLCLCLVCGLAALAGCGNGKNTNQLVVATNAAFEPFEYTDGDKYLGIDMEIAALLAEELDKELVIDNMKFDAVCLSVGQQKCDIAMAGLTINDKRKESVNFSESYYTASQKLIVKNDDQTFAECKTVDDVVAILKALPKDTKIGVQTGTTGQFYIEGDEEWEFDGYDVQCVGYENGSLAVQDMLNDNIDFVVIDAAPADCITEAINETANGLTAKVIDISLTDEEYAFGVDKTQPELLEKVNAFIKELKASGKLEEICNKYFAGGEPTPVISAKKK